MLDFDFSKIPHDDLIRMEAAIKKEKDKRKDARYVELATQFCDAYNALKAEFPYVELGFESECPNCDESMNYNIFDQFDKLSPSMLNRG